MTKQTDAHEKSAANSRPESGQQVVVVSGEEATLPSRVESNETQPKQQPTEQSSTMSTNGNECEASHLASKTNLFLAPNDPSLIKFSKSDNSLIDSFVLLGDASPDKHHQHTRLTSMPGRSNNFVSPTSKPEETLRPQSSADQYAYSRGRPKDKSLAAHRVAAKQALERSQSGSCATLLPDHCWRRELYLRGVLPRRRGASNATAVTCLTISKDHRNLYVGDACGRINCWTTN